MGLLTQPGDPVNFSDPFGLDPCKSSSAWTECLAQGLANFGAKHGSDAMVFTGAALNALFEASGINAAASAGDAIGNGDVLAGGGEVALAVAPTGRLGGRAAVGGVIAGYQGSKRGVRHALHQAISRDGGLGVSPSAILDAVRNPLKIIEQANGRRLFRGENAAVVVDEAGQVVTTWARGSAGIRNP